ncbi:acetyl-CoA carboxylase carboxyltransferase subunit alpha [Pajaroellobacter abortibovis]|uniref:Acetyl-coenzyme A carboxylase carboxyl transferase subunit alpha n=1 Tax=Pajaroellobacter abortibovis TaxID=1882918 RepID=A0A1L6MXH6_9BACT|nr:acetyl-CoA carboxylase carboxyltransferase subunit alpha [Pajaroellobacter abortibovis]APS00210.1 acetyl-CoA carboxylase carboxyltransferase subunit alpha [Pajaroellobacter abortibovis]
MASHVLSFEKPVVELVARVQELRSLELEDQHLEQELHQIESTTNALAREWFSELSPWQKVQLSRHPSRPYTLDYIPLIFSSFYELHGDRAFRDDASIVGGLGLYQGRSVVIVGHQKGRGTKENVERNFGMPHPEGYRKALRLYKMADRFGLPILTFIDTPGAYPGVGAEERGQSEAIGSCIATMAKARVPIIATIIGEGGSGGALALGVANRVHVLEYGTYSVISPEGCASILWKDTTKASEAAVHMKMTASDLLELGIVDRIVQEPPGGAHQNLQQTAQVISESIGSALEELAPLSPKELIQDRYRRFRQLGSFKEALSTS